MIESLYWDLTSLQPIRLLKNAPYMILIEAVGRVVACFSSSLTDVLFNLHYGCQISLFFAIPLFFPSKVFIYHLKTMLLSKFSKREDSEVLAVVVSTCVMYRIKAKK